MGLYGGLVKGTGVVAGGAARAATCLTLGLAADFATYKGHEKLGEHLGNANEKIGSGLQTALVWTGKKAGEAVDATFSAVTRTVGNVSAGIAEIAGADDDTVEIVRKVGTVATGAGIGLVAGNCAGAALTNVVVAHGTASTGTAISSIYGAARTKATLAALGGGTLASGGGGIAAGKAVLNGINVAAAVEGGIEGAMKIEPEFTIEDYDLAERIRNYNNMDIIDSTCEEKEVEEEDDDEEEKENI